VLDCVDHQEPVLSTPEVAAERPSSRPASVVALVVDSAVMAHMFASAVAAEGAVSERVDSGAGLLERLVAARPRVIVVRRTLDHADGIDVIRSIRTHPALRRARFLVASAEPSTAAEVLAAGAHGFLRVPCSQEEARATLRAHLASRPRILVVDDSRAQRLLVMPALRQEGWEVLEADDGRHALEVLRNAGDVDLVISDVEMPHMDGFALCATLKGTPGTAHVPVILLTHLDGNDAIARGFDAGANDYLAKPVVLPELVSRARPLLEPPDTRRSERIVVVDDDALRRVAQQVALESQGFDVIACEGPEDALARLAQQDATLAIIDAGTAAYDGVAFIRRLRTEPVIAALPVVLVTGRRGRADDVRATSAGVQAIVSRPYTPDRLVAVVERVLAEARAARQRAMLRRYLSGEALAAVERFVETGRTDPRAATRHRSILFADLAGFTALCERLDAASVVSVLNRFFDVVVPVLVRHGASIDKLIGDCVMAVYDGGGPGALDAAQGARELVGEVMPALRAELGLELHLRVGIESGDVVVGDIGSEAFRRDWTVIGDAVNVAQRVQGAAEVDEVLLGPGASELLAGAVTLGPPRVLQVKGRAAPVAVRPLR
jgi:adenylate cyclase